MATRTISAAGGDWNATATWVGGVVPISTDDIIGNATSGNLTINIAQANIRFCNFTGYTGTLTISGTNQFRIQGASSASTTTLGSGMTIAGTGYFRTGAQTLISNGVLIPNFEPAFSNTTTILSDDVNCTNYVMPLGNATKTLNGQKVNTVNFLATARDAGGSGLLQGTTVINLNDANSTWDSSAVSLFQSNVALPIQINTTGTFTITSHMNLGFDGSLTWIQGTVAGDKSLRLIANTVTSNRTYTFNTPGVDWDYIWVTNATNTASITNTITLDSNLEFQSFTILPLYHGGVTPFTNTISFGGTGALVGGDFAAYARPFLGTGDTLSTNAVPRVSFPSGSSHQFSSLSITGMDASVRAIFSSPSSPGVSINLTGSQNIFFTDFTNVVATGNTIYTYQGGATGTTNIQVAQNYLPTSASTFVS
jgi:hypothetical protein